MGSCFYDPNSDVQTLWDTTGVNHFGEIDEGAREPDVPTLTDYVSTLDNNAIDEWGFPAVIEPIESIIWIKAWLYVETGGNATIQVSFQQDGVERASTTVPVSTSKSWVSCEWTAPSGDLSTLTIEAKQVKSGGGGATTAYVYAAYLEVDPDVDEQVGAQADDGESTWKTGVHVASNITAGYTRLGGGSTATGVYGAGARFQTVDVPNGATIDHAYVEWLRSIYDGGNSNAMQFKVYFEAVDDATALSASDPDRVFDRKDSGTATKHDWDFSTQWQADTWYGRTNDALDIAGSCQNVVDRPGWAANQDMLVFSVDDGTSLSISTRTRNACTYDTTGNVSGPKLHIEYTEAGGETFYQAVAGAFTSAGVVTKKTETPKAGAITFVGVSLRTMKFARTILAGAISFVGTSSRTMKFARSVVAGTLTMSGTVLSKAKKVLTGAFTSSGVLVSKAKKVLAGTFTSAGDLAKKTLTFIAGALTSAGVLAKKTVTSKTGVITFTGTSSRTMKFARTVLSGVITLAGAVAKKTSLSFAGMLTSSGVLIGKAKKVLAGTLTSAGALAKKTSKSFVGALTSAGVLVRKTEKVLTGVITFVGIVTKKTEKVFAGAFTSSGVLVGKAKKSLVGAITSSGVLAKKTSKVFAGTFTSAGTLVRKAGKAISGTITFIGASLRTMKFARTVLAGALTLSGAVVKKAKRTLTGGFASSGVLISKAKKLLVGSLTPSGVSTKKTTKSFAGTLTYVGTLTIIRVFHRILTGAITFTGTLTRKTGKVLTGAVTLAGTISKLTRKILSGALTFIGRVTGVAPVKVIHLTLYDRSTALTLNARSTDLTLEPRSTDLTLPSR